MTKKDDIQSGGNKVIISAPVVSKPFVMKNGQALDHQEFYIQRSVQDYFIKFCESKVSRKEMEKALNKSNDPIKTLKMEVEFKDGLWDQCPDDEYEVQSRVGEYVVLYRIIEH